MGRCWQSGWSWTMEGRGAEIVMQNKKDCLKRKERYLQWFQPLNSLWNLLCSLPVIKPGEFSPAVTLDILKYVRPFVMELQFQCVTMCYFFVDSLYIWFIAEGVVLTILGLESISPFNSTDIHMHMGVPV